MKIRVEQGHIKNGIPQRATKCPIARAMRGAGFQEPIVARSWIAAKKGGKSYTFYNLPLTIAAFIEAFDSGDRVEPFEFEMDLTNPGTGSTI